MVSVYRCYILGASDHFIGSRVFRGTDDEAAIRFSKDLCKQLLESCHGIELWQGARLLLRQRHRSGELVLRQPEPIAGRLYDYPSMP